MPRSLFRIVACLLLALAVPVQGVAAVTAGVCMAVGEHHGHGASHDHESAPAHDEHSAGGHCTPCVSCCAATAISPRIDIPLVEVTPLAAVAAPQYWLAGVPPDELDRPPLAL